MGKVRVFFEGGWDSVVERDRVTWWKATIRMIKSTRTYGNREAYRLLARCCVDSVKWVREGHF
ncbi:MAG: hypothetical protein E6K69_02195 [Nitrospirae bacterium]|nr:MAG: hypothetical protein E6K69_02195 [Nitrospirota bacterium]